MSTLSRRSFLRLAGQGMAGLALASNQLIAYANSDPFYTLSENDLDWVVLVERLNVGGDDPIGTLLLWNPEIKNPYNLQLGQRLRIPDRTNFPAYPKYDNDFSKWKVIGTHTSKFRGLNPWYRTPNIITGMNAINNWFSDGSHPFISPRGLFSLNSILGETGPDKGYKLGSAIMVINGEQVDVPSYGGGICQIPTTIFPAALKAGLNVLQRRNHSYYPYWWYEYPEGFGFDATTGTPDDPDLVIRNMYNHPVFFWGTVDENERTLRVDVYAPLQLIPYEVEIEGPFLGRDKNGIPTRDLNRWVTGPAQTVVYQKVNVGDSKWEKKFPSYYAASPH